MAARIHVSLDTPVGAALARIAARYHVAIEDALTFEIDAPTMAVVAESDSFGLIWLEASDLEALALSRDVESLV